MSRSVKAPYPAVKLDAGGLLQNAWRKGYKAQLKDNQIPAQLALLLTDDDVYPAVYAAYEKAVEQGVDAAAPRSMRAHRAEAPTEFFGEFNYC